MDAPTFPIRLQLRGSPYGRQLYDVDGTILLSPGGDHLHVYSPLLQDEFTSGRLRLLRDTKWGYRYFVTSQAQLDRFQVERDLGTPYYRRTYHVYQDTDFDPSGFISKGVHIVS
jgi:hypothetical protein